MTSLVLAAGLWLAAQPVPAAAAASGVWWSAEALHLRSLSEVDSRLHDPLTDLPKVVSGAEPPRAVQNCADLIELTQHRFHLQPDDGVSWRGFESEAAKCFALSTLKNAKPPTRSYVHWFQLSPEAVARLPPGMTLASSQDDMADIAAAAKKCQPLGAYEENLHVSVKGDAADVDTDGWSGRIVLYARGDLNGDGLEDLMLLRQGQVKEGTAADSSLFIVTQTSPRGCLKILRTLPQALGRGR